MMALQKYIIHLTILSTVFRMYSAYIFNRDKLILTKYTNSLLLNSLMKCYLRTNMDIIPDSCLKSTLQFNKNQKNKSLGLKEYLSISDILEPAMTIERRKRNIQKIPNKPKHQHSSSTEITGNKKQRSLFSDLIDLPKSRNITVVKPSQIHVFGSGSYEHANFNRKPDENSRLDNHQYNLRIDEKTAFQAQDITKIDQNATFKTQDISKIDEDIIDRQDTQTETKVQNFLMFPATYSEPTTPFQLMPKTLKVKPLIMKSINSTNKPLKGEPSETIDTMNTKKVNNSDLKTTQSKISPNNRQHGTDMNVDKIERTLVKILAILSTTFKKIKIQQAEIKKSQSEVILANKELMSKRIEVIRKLKDFDKKHKQLMDQGLNLAALQYVVAAKQETFLEKETELLTKKREFDELKRQFADHQLKFYKLQKFLLNETNRTINKAVLKTKEDIQNSFSMREPIKNEETLNVGNTSKTSDEITKTEDYIFSNRILNSDQDILNDKDFKDIDELVHKYYFHNTTIDKLMKNFRKCNCSKNITNLHSNEKFKNYMQIPFDDIVDNNIYVKNNSNNKILSEKEVQPKDKAKKEAKNTELTKPKIFESNLKEHEKIVLESPRRYKRWMKNPTMNLAETHNIDYMSGKSGFKVTKASLSDT